MKYLFLDTNIFLHYRHFEDIPWKTVVCDDFTLVVAPIVLDELDKHKDREKGKIQKRAKKISSLLYEVLMNGKECKVPVLYCKEPVPTKEDAEKMDLSTNDNRLILSALKSGYIISDIVIVSGDKGIQFRAASNGLAHILLPDTYRLSPEKTDEEKEIERLKEELKSYREKEGESAARYESISRTLLAAQESAAAQLQSTNQQCETKLAETTAQCQQMLEETTAKCDELKRTTQAECDKLTSETDNSCANKKYATEAYCEDLTKKTEEAAAELKRTSEAEAERLKSVTEVNCASLLEETTKQCDEKKAATRDEVLQTRTTIKRECESISEFIAQLMASVKKVSNACEETKAFADNAFGDVSSQS